MCQKMSFKLGIFGVEFLVSVFVYEPCNIVSSLPSFVLFVIYRHLCVLIVNYRNEYSIQELKLVKKFMLVMEFILNLTRMLLIGKWIHIGFLIFITGWTESPWTSFLLY